MTVLRRILQRTRAFTRAGLLVCLAAAVSVVGNGVIAEPASAASATFTFTGSGWGHAVGMSQWGARGMAAAGSTYDNILKWYYKGTTVGTGHSVTSNVRLLVTQRQSAITLTTSGSTTFGGAGTLPAGATVVASRSGNSIKLSGALSATVSSPLTIDLDVAGGPLRVTPGGDSYRYGTLSVKIDSVSGLRAVLGSMSMQEYLLGLGEMYSTWPIEALKAQATASRTFAEKQIAARKYSSAYPDFDLYANTIDQAYRGTRFESEPTHSNWVNAVNSTNGMFVLYAGNLIDAVYSASSGGHTVNSELVWGGTLPYLKGVSDPYDLTGGNPNASWSVTYTAAELGSWFGVGTATAVKVTGKVPTSGHLDGVAIQVVGTKGTRTTDGTAFRTTINARTSGSRVLRSTKFLPAGAPSGGTAVPHPKYTPATGRISAATANGRRVTISGDAVDPDGAPLVRVVSTMGRERAVRDYRPTNGKFVSSWIGSPGTRNVCVTIYDTPTGAAKSLGCRNIVVK